MTRPFRTGEPVWIELSAADPAAAARFYSELLGWEIRDEHLDRRIYRMCSVDGRIVAGISDGEHLHGGEPRGWITYFAVEDVPTTADRAVSLGGDVLMRSRYVAAAGSGATIRDPFGAVFGLYQGEARSGVELLNTVGALCWNELDTGEPEQSIAFYETLFGFEVEHLDSATNRPYAVLSVAGEPVAGVLALDSAWPNPIPARWITYLSVSSLEEALTTVSALGGIPTVGPFTSPHGRLHLIRDPDGNAVCLMELQIELRSSAGSKNPGVGA